MVHLFALIFLFILANANAEHHLTGVKLPLVHRARVLFGAVTDFGMDVVGDGLGGYYVTLGVGRPAIEQTLRMDTGSDLTWIQCQGCEPNCFSQSHQMRYDPTKSNSIKWVPCPSDTCELLEKKDGCSSEKKQCIYRFGYADGTYTFGSLALETLTINGTAIPSIIMGCASENHIELDGEADGLLGLGMGPLSYTTQPNGQTGRAFRFCLGENDGWLHFGRSNFPSNHSKWASLILNDKHPSFYYVELLSIEVEGKALNIPEDTFQIDTKTGKGGVIIDTGTSHTYLPKVAYNALRDTVKKYLQQQQQQQDKSLITPITSPDPAIFDTCYSLGSGVELESVQLPRVSFILRGVYVQTDPTIQINATNILLYDSPNNNNIIVCLAFAPSTTPYSILAGRQLEDIQITIDASAGNIGFGPNAC